MLSYNLGWYKNGKFAQPLELGLNPQLLETTFYFNDVASLETEVLMTYDDQDNYMAAYTYGLERIKVQELDDTRPETQDPLYYLYDGLGSVSQMIRPNGAVRDHYGYDEYGVPSPGAKLSEDGRNVNHNTFGYTGEMWDEEDNLLYLRSRYYMPEVGRFINRDVFPGYAVNPLSMHKYAYVENSPLNWVDPLGFNKKDQNVFYGPPSPAQIYGPPNPYQDIGVFVDNWQLLDGYTQGTGKTGTTTAVKQGASLAAGFTPVLGDIKDVQETLTGRDLITGEKLTAGERVVTGVTIFLPVVNGKAVRTGIDAAKRFTPDQQALIQLAKEAKKAGQIALDEAQALLRWADEYNVPWHGPEVHLNRNFKDNHIHVGPVDHIKVE